ncbi:MAG: hypothetical protein E7673_05210 [Ruminococcaceae bacterium]|nr:hypothetical protein [Oscillospiraceae bacterium]
MIRENKFKIIISSVTTLLPMIVGICLWGKISEGYEGVMRSVKIMAIFVLPSVMVLLNALCLIFTHLDSKNREQNKKVIALVLWILPLISVYASMIFYSVLLGWNVDFQILTSALLGVMFVIIGNYMPKSKQNRTIGVKIRWTLANEENWNATHRFTGKLWFFIGFAMIFSGFLPGILFVIAFAVILLTAVILPFLYSYLYYKNNLKSGNQRKEDYDFARRPCDKKVAVISIVAVSVILIAAAVLMFTGNVEISLDENALLIEASYHSDESVSYTDITEIEYRVNTDKGMRVVGFASARLLLGMFKNDEFGSYTRFSYVGCDDDIILTVGERKIAISAKNEAETRALYQALLEKLKK